MLTTGRLILSAASMPMPFEQMTLGARFISATSSSEKQKPFETSSIFIRKGRTGDTLAMSQTEKLDAVRAVYGPRDPLVARWVSPTRDAEIQEADGRLRFLKGHPQRERIRKSKETPMKLADTVLVEEFLKTWEGGWKRRFLDRQEWLAEEKKRLWALRETTREERFAHKQRLRKLRGDHWQDIMMERRMLKAEMRRRNQIENRKIAETMSAARKEMLQSLNEESDNWWRHPDEAVNRRYLTFAYQRWYNFKN